MIEFKNINFSFKEKNILNNFNLNILENEFVSIIGSSGSGKTTVLKLINQLLIPNSGTILVNNIDIKNKNVFELRKSIGYVIQSNGLFPHLSVHDNIAYVLNLEKKSKEFIEQRVFELIKIVNIDVKLLQSFPNELSGGQKQRVGIARALANNSNILLMDEPFGAVDEITRKSLQKELKKLHQENDVTIVFVTHDINEAMLLSDRIIVMHEGVIDQIGTPYEIKNNPKTDFVKLLIS